MPQLAIMKQPQLLQEQMPLGFHELFNAKIDEAAVLLPNLLLLALAYELHGSAHFEASLALGASKWVRVSLAGILLTNAQ
jgi:hypothetical protein